MSKSVKLDHKFNQEKYAELLDIARGFRTQTAFAEECGLSVAYMCKSLNGHLPSPPIPSTIKKIAENAHNNITYEELMNAAGYNITMPHTVLQSPIKMPQYAPEIFIEFSEDMQKMAEACYKEIRTFSTDVEKIAKNTGYTYDQILMIKNYLFMFYHDIHGKMKQFDVSFEIAESWCRLAFDPKNIQLHDFVLLQHELLEMQYVNSGFSQQMAHHKTEEVYNYALMSNQYYRKLQLENGEIEEDFDRDDFVGDAIMGYNTH